MGLRPGPWLDAAIERGLIAPGAHRVVVDAPDPDCSEAAFQAAVMKLARACGWLCYHTHDSRRSQVGFPDVCCVRDGVLLFLELKAAAGRLREGQREWLVELGRVPGILACVFRPADWPAIVETLR